MKIYHVEPVGVYGTSGSFVLAKTNKKAEELFLKQYPHNKKYKLSITLSVDNCEEEYVLPEMLW